MTLALHERGLFTWSEWASALSAAIKRAQAAGDCDDGSTYYRHWLDAIEHLVETKGVTDEAALVDRRAAWDRAAHATPHGEPILLENDPHRRPLRGGSASGGTARVARGPACGDQLPAVLHIPKRSVAPRPSTKAAARSSTPAMTTAPRVPRPPATLSASLREHRQGRNEPRREGGADRHRERRRHAGRKQSLR